MSNKIKSITRFFNIRDGEGLPLFLLMVHSFFNGVTFVFFDTSAYTLFLGQFSVKSLPYVYIGTGIAAMILGFAYTKLEGKVSPATLFKITLSFLVILITGLYIALQIFQSKFIVFLVAVGSEIICIIACLELWALAGLMFNIRQSKRLLGLIVASQEIPGLIGGLSIPLIVQFWDVKNLLLVAAGGMIASLTVLMYIIRVYPLSSKEEESDDNKNTSVDFKDRYLHLFFVLTVLSFFGFYLIDYIFLDQVSSFFTDDKKLASFFGIFFAILSVTQLFFSVFASGHLITKYGIGFALLALPLFVSMGSGLALIGMLITGSTFVFFTIICITKLLDQVLRDAVEAPAFQILYQPFPIGQRLRVQSIRESIVEPMAVGLCGVLILFLTSILSISVIGLTILALILIAVWVVIGILLRRKYTSSLLNALTKRRLAGIFLSLEDSSSLAVLQKRLGSPNPGEVIYCLDMLEGIEHKSLSSFYLNLIDHPEPMVREYVMKKIDEHHMVPNLEAVRERVKIEESPRIRGFAIRTLCSLAEDEVFENISPYLEDSEPDIVKGAMIGLLRNGGIDGVLISGSSLNSLLSSDLPGDRKFAAEVLGEVGISSFYRPLVTLLRDDRLEVRGEALVASRKLKNINLLPYILENMTMMR